MSGRLSVCPSIFLPVRISVFMTVCLTVHVSVNPPVCSDKAGLIEISFSGNMLTCHTWVLDYFLEGEKNLS